MNLGGLVSPEAAELYRRLVQDGPAPVDSPELAELDAAGLTTRTPCHPGMVVAVLPEVVCGELLTSFAADLADRHARLQAQLADVVAQQREAPKADGRVELLTDPHAIKRVADEVLAAARREAGEFAVATHGAGLVDVAEVEPLVGPGVRYRVVYATSCLDDEVGRHIVELARKAGEEQRFFAGWLTSLRYADDAEALVRLAEGALHVRSRPLVSLLRTWFDLVWERASPPEDDEVRLTGIERAVLAQLAAGHKDAAIARALGLHVRTVRRHVAGILTCLGVSSRFEAGVAAVRNGWI